MWWCMSCVKVGEATREVWSHISLSIMTIIPPFFISCKELGGRRLATAAFDAAFDAATAVIACVPHAKLGHDQMRKLLSSRRG